MIQEKLAYPDLHSAAVLPALDDNGRMDQQWTPRTPPGGASRRTTWVLSVGVTLLVLGIVFSLDQNPQLNGVRRMLGLGEDRVLAAPEDPGGNGSFKFLSTQRDGKTPVGYDPCQVIEIQINPQGAPADHLDLVETAARHVSAATGLAFEVIGTTDDRPGDRMDSVRRQPVLVAWAIEDEVPDLADDVAGVAGSQAVSMGGGRAYYVTGSVVLDIDVFDNERTAPEQLQAIVDHEFGHLVGLDHVDDTTELMYSETVGVQQFAEGDLRGLAKIGRIPCN